MALRADDEQPSGLPDLVRLAGDFRLVLGQLFGKELPGVQNLLVVRVGVARGVHNDLLGVPRLGQVRPGKVFGVAPQHDIGAAARHVGGYGDGPQLARLGDNLRLFFVVLGVQQVVLDALPGQELGKKLVFLDGHGAHQHGLALFVALLDLLDDGPELSGLGLIDHVVVVAALVGAVGGDLDDVQVVDGPEFLLLRHGRSGHAGELVIEPEVVLEGNRRQGPVFAVDVDMLLGLDGLVEAVGVPPAKHQPAGELVHDDDFPVLHHIVDVPFHGAVGLEGLVDVVADGGVGGVGEVLHMEVLLGLGNAPGGKGGGFGLFVHHIVRVDVRGLLFLVVHLDHHLLFQLRDEHLRQVVHLGGLLPLAGDNEGRPGLVDKDGVHLVHDGEGMAPLDQLLGVDAHVVPEVVEAHLVVGSVGDVGGVGLLALLGGQPVDNEAHLEPQETVDLAHPLAVALGQVVVDGDNVDPLPRQGVEVGGKGRHQGLALAGLHLGDAALMEDDAAHQLHPVGPEAQHPVRRLPGGGEGLGENVVQSLAVLQALFELLGLCLELGVAHGLVLIGHGLNFVRDGGNGFQLPGAVVAENLLNQAHDCLKLPFDCSAARKGGNFIVKQA